MLKYRGKTRPDMGPDCEERFDPKFLKWVWGYPKSQRPDVLNRLQSVPAEKQVIMLDSQKQVRDFLTRVGKERRL